MIERTAISARGNLAAQLERDRLAHRIARLRTVVAALDERRRFRDGQGAIPLPLIQAIKGFRRELREAERRLAALDQGAVLRTAEP